MINTHLEVVRDVRTTDGERVFPGFNERFEARCQTQAERDSEDQGGHFKTEKAVPEKNQNEHKALRDVQRFQRSIRREQPVAEAIVVLEGDERRRHHDQRTGDPSQDAGSRLPERGILFQGRFEQFLEDPEM